MDEAGNIVSRIAMLAVYIFGAMSVLAICYAGFMYMTAAGDPQKSGQARNALFGAIGGMIIVGVAFMVPRLISETVIEPSGGASIGGSTTVSCDEVFRNQLVRQQAAGNASRMNQVKVQVQQRQAEECASEVWDPIVFTNVVGTGDGQWGNTAAGYEDVVTPPAYANTSVDKCATLARAAGAPSATNPAFSSRTIGGLQVPPGLERFVSHAGPRSGRDGENNIIVYFHGHQDNRPSDGAACWMYVHRLGNWITGVQQ